MIATSHPQTQAQALPRRPPRRLHLWAGLVAVLQGVTMYLLTVRGDFYVDDFINYGLARENTLGTNYVGLPIFGHFHPGFRTAFFVFQHALPFDYNVVRCVMVAIDVAILLAFWRLLTLLLGSRPINLLLLAGFGFSMTMLTGNVWLSNSLNALPMLLLLILAVDGHVRWMVRGRARDLVLGGVSLALSLAFYEKPVLFALYLPLLLVLLFAPRLAFRPVLRTVLRAWPLWVLDAALLLPYAYYTLRHPYTGTPQTSDLGLYLEGTARGWLFNVVPSSVGGPWQWYDIGGSMSSLPTGLVAGIDQFFFAGLIAVTLVVRRHALRWWMFLGVAVVATMVLLVRFRAVVYGLVITEDPRYVADTTLLLYLAAGLAMVGPRIGPLAAVDGWRENSLSHALRGLRATRVPRIAAGLAAVLGGIAFAVPALHVANRWHREGSATFMNTARHDLAALPAGSSLWDGDVPVVPVSYAPYNTVASLVSLIGAPVRIDGWDATSFVMDDTGHVLRAHFAVDAHGTAQSSPCEGSTMADAYLRATLDDVVAPGRHFLVFRYSARPGTMLHVAAGQAGGSDVDAAGIAFGPLGGEGVAVVRLLPIEMTSLRLSVPAGGAMCVADVEVGHPQALPDQAPGH